jgi:hypothetical protein
VGGAGAAEPPAGGAPDAGAPDAGMDGACAHAGGAKSCPPRNRSDAMAIRRGTLVIVRAMIDLQVAVALS